MIVVYNSLGTAWNHPCSDQLRMVCYNHK